MSAVFAFSGSRSLSSAFAPAVGALVGSLPAGASVLVGDAPGADSFVRAACPGARVFGVSGGVRSAAALVGRSVSLVRAAAAAPGSALVVLPGGPCPAGVVPASAWRSGAAPSGSWSSAALAAGLGVAVVVVWCGGSPCLPAWPGGCWLPLSALPWAPSAVLPVALPVFAWSPAPAGEQLALF